MLGLRKRESVKDPDNESKRSRNVAMEPALSSIPQSLVANWVVLFQGLVKGKVKVDVSVRSYSFGIYCVLTGPSTASSFLE